MPQRGPANQPFAAVEKYHGDRTHTMRTLLPFVLGSGATATCALPTITAATCFAGTALHFRVEVGSVPTFVHSHLALLRPPEKSVFQSSLMLMTIQPSALAVSISAWLKVPTDVSRSPSAGP